MADKNKIVKTYNIIRDGVPTKVEQDAADVAAASRAQTAISTGSNQVEDMDRDVIETLLKHKR